MSGKPPCEKALSLAEAEIDAMIAQGYIPSREKLLARVAELEAAGDELCAVANPLSKAVVTWKSIREESNV